jgi:diacylglycerol O-acyltransferase
MSNRLSFLDTLFLDLEQADPNAHMHIGAALIFDPLPGGGAPSIDALRAHLGERLALLPRYSQRLSAIHTSPLHRTEWEPVGRPDLTTHVREAALPAGATEETLRDWLGEFWSHRLDRTLPLWELVLVTGLPRDRWALASKTHHCLVDGIGSLDIGYALLDTEPHPAPLPCPLPEDYEPPAGRDWLAPLRDAAHLIRHPRQAAETAVAMTELLAREEVIPAPATSLNGTLSGWRRFGTAAFDLADIKAIKNERGGTVNDVVLALCTGGLRHLLLHRHEEPAHDLRAQIPVNLRDLSREHDLGNQIGTLIAELPVTEPDPEIRYVLVRERAEHLKHSNQILAARGLTATSEALPPAVGAQLGRLLFNHQRAFNLTITNVPGPQQPFYAFGARLRELLPLVPLFNTHRLGIAVISYDGRLTFGLNCDRTTSADLDVLVEGIEQSFAELNQPVPAHH